MDIAMVTARKGQLAAFRAGLEQRSARVECFADGWSFLQAVRARSWHLGVVDAVTSRSLPGGAGIRHFHHPGLQERKV